MNTKKFSIKFYPGIDKINKQKLIHICAGIVAYWFKLSQLRFSNSKKQNHKTAKQL